MIKELWAKISYFWFITILLIVGFFVGADFTYAATNADWSSTLLEVQQCEQSCNVHGLNCSLTNCINDSTDKRGTEGRLTFGSTNGHLKKLQLQVFAGSNVFPSGNYTFNSTVAIDPKVIEELKTNYNILIYGNTSSSSSGASTGNNYFSGKACTIENETGSYDFTLNCIFNTNVDLKYFNFSIENNGNGEPLTNTNALYWRSFNTFSYTADPTGAINNQTSIIENNFNDLNDNLTNNTNTIIDNQNANSQAQIDAQKVCNDIDYNFVNVTIDDSNFTVGSLGGGGSIDTSSTSWRTSNYIEVSNGSTISFSKDFGTASNVKFCFYDNSKVKLSCSNDITGVATSNGFVRFNVAAYLRPLSVKISTCKDGNQALNDTLTDDDIDSPDSKINEFEDLLPTNGTITQLIGLPITLYTKVLNSINGTCSQFDLGELYGTNLIIPCINLSSYLGSNLWNLIDLIVSGSFVLIIAKKMIKVFENFTSMKEGDVIGD